MASNILSTDNFSDKIYRHVGFTSVHTDSFSSPSTSPNGITYDGTNLFSCDSSSDKIYKHNGFTNSLSDSFSSPSTSPTSLTCDISNLYSTDSSTNRIYKHTGFTSAILDSFSSPSTNLRGSTCNGTDIYSSDATTNKIYKHNGFSNTILDSFSTIGTTSVADLAYDGTNMYFISGSSGTAKITKLSGFTSTILDSFTSPSISPSGLEWEDFAARLGITLTQPTVKSVAVSLQHPTIITESIISVAVKSIVVSQPPSTFTNAVTTNVKSVVVTLNSPTIIINFTASVSVLNLTVNRLSPAVRTLQPTSFAIKVISYNPLLLLSNTSPIQITRVALTSPDNPTWEVYNFTGFSNPTSVTVDDTHHWIYMSCADGKVAKIDMNDLTSYSTIDVTDLSDLLTISCLPDFGLVYASTNEATAEVYMIDDRPVTNTINTNFPVTVQLQSLLNTAFSTLEAKIISTKFTILGLSTNNINTNFVVLPAVYVGTESDFIGIFGSPLGTTIYNFLNSNTVVSP